MSTVAKEDYVWIGFMDIVPVIGTIKESVELVLALYEGNEAVVKEKEKAIENIVKESFKTKLVKKSTLPDKPRAAAAEYSKDVTEVKKAMITEHVMRVSKRGTKSSTPDQQKEREEREKKVKAVKNNMLAKIHMINPTFKDELKEELTRSKRGEHVFNNDILKFHSKLLTEFIQSNNMYNQAEYNQEAIHELGKHTVSPKTAEEIQTKMVVDFDEDEFYVNANGVVYGVYWRALRDALLDVLRHINPDDVTDKERERVNFVKDNLNNLQIYVDEMAKVKWIANIKNRHRRFKKVRKEVVNMYNTERWFEEDTVWIGFMDIVPVIGTVKESVELVLALYEGNEAVVNEKEMAIENILKEPFKKKLAKKSTLPDKPRAAAAEYSKDVTEVKKAMITEHVMRVSKRGTNSSTPDQQKEREEREKKVKAVKNNMLEKIHMINPTFKDELKEELTRSKRGKHVFNNDILKFHSKVLTDFIQSPNMHNLRGYNQEAINALGKHTVSPETAKEIQTEMVVDFDEDEFYVNANGVVYGVYWRALHDALLDVLRHINPDDMTDKEKKRVNFVKDNFNNLQIYVDEMAKVKWIGNTKNRRKRFKKVRKEVVNMYNTERWFEEGTVWIGFMDIVPVIGTIKESVELVLALYEGNEAVVKEKEMAIENILKKSTLHDKPRAAAAEFSKNENVIEVRKALITEYVKTVSKRGTKSSTPDQQKEREEREKKVKAVKKDMLEKIRMINPTFKDELKEELTSSKRSEHVFNNDILEFNSKLLTEFIQSNNMYNQAEYNQEAIHELGKHTVSPETAEEIQTKMVVDFDEDEFYVNANGVVYGVYWRALRDALLDVLRHINPDDVTDKERERVNFVKDNMNNLQIYVDEMAKVKWIANIKNRHHRFKKVRKEVVNMYNTERWFEEDTVWIGFMDIVPVIGTVKESVELVLALYEGNEAVVNEKEMAIKNIVKEPFKKKLAKKSTLHDKLAAAAAESSKYVIAVRKEMIFEYAMKGSKGGTKPQTSTQQKEREKIIEEVLKKIHIINPKFKGELKEELKRSKKGEHVFNNDILKFHSKVLDDFLKSPEMCNLRGYNQQTMDTLGKHTLSQNTAEDIQTNMVVHFDEDEPYLNANAVVYGIFCRALRDALLDVLRCINPDDITKKKRKRVNFVIEKMNYHQVYVDEMAKDKWIANDEDRRAQVKEVRQEVLTMYNTDRGLDWCRRILEEVAPLFGNRQ